MTDLNAIHTEAISKGATFLLGAAGSAIAFGLHETSTRTESLSLYIAAAAILLWCCSFASGIFRSDAHENSIQANIIINEAVKITKDPVALKPLKDRYERRANAQVRWRRFQLWLLFAGAIVYVIAQATYVQEQTAIKAEATSHPSNKSTAA